MANTFTQLLYHVVFTTKERRPVLQLPKREELYRYIWGIHKNHNCHLYRIGGVEDHVHILTSIPTTLDLATYVREVKTGSSQWAKTTGNIPRFPGWQDGYGAFTVSWSEKDTVIEYIIHQPEHHARESFAEEYRRLLGKAGIEFAEQYLL